MHSALKDVNAMDTEEHGDDSPLLDEEADTLTQS